MVRLLNAKDKDFTAQFQTFLDAREEEQNVGAAVTTIIDRVRKEGGAALLDYTRQFDRYNVADVQELRVKPEQVTQALALCAPELITALKVAAKRIRAYSERQMPEDARWTDDEGIELGWKWTPLDAVGLYVPGGLAAYPSSVLMNAVLAKVAGVQRLVITVPAPEGILSPAVLAAAHIAGVDEIWKIGGAQAVAALAYGTEVIAPVDKIVGPGNAYVAEAKRQVFGRVGIDMIAGPSEILVVADNQNPPEWIAADLLSQAEHDAMAQSILITDDATYAKRVMQAAEIQLQILPRAAIARASWQAHGAVIVVDEWADAVPLINTIAPEHLELALENPEPLAAHIRHAGAIFLGRYTPEAVGDYLAGPSHVLPTSRSARFSSGLSVLDFLKRTSLTRCTSDAFARINKYGDVLATTEGLEAHANSFRVRKT